MRVKTGVKIEDIRDNYHTRSEKCGKLDCFKGINHTSRVKLRATFSLIVSHDIMKTILETMNVLEFLGVHKRFFSKIPDFTPVWSIKCVFN